MNMVEGAVGSFVQYELMKEKKYREDKYLYIMKTIDWLIYIGELLGSVVEWTVDAVKYLYEGLLYMG